MPTNRRIDFILGSQPVGYRIAIFKTTMLGMEISGNSNLIVMLGCLAFVALVIGDGSLFMLPFCSVYGMRHDAPPLKKVI